MKKIVKRLLTGQWREGKAPQPTRTPELRRRTRRRKNKAELEKIALEQIQGRLDGKAVRKVIVAPGRLVNVVV